VEVTEPEELYRHMRAMGFSGSIHDLLNVAGELQIEN